MSRDAKIRSQRSVSGRQRQSSTDRYRHEPEHDLRIDVFTRKAFMHGSRRRQLSSTPLSSVCVCRAGLSPARGETPHTMNVNLCYLPNLSARVALQLSVRVLLSSTVLHGAWCPQGPAPARRRDRQQCKVNENQTYYATGSAKPCKQKANKSNLLM